MEWSRHTSFVIGYYVMDKMPSMRWAIELVAPDEIKEKPGECGLENEVIAPLLGDLARFSCFPRSHTP